MTLCERRPAARDCFDHFRFVCHAEDGLLLTSKARDCAIFSRCGRTHGNRTASEAAIGLSGPSPVGIVQNDPIDPVGVQQNAQLAVGIGAVRLKEATPHPDVVFGHAVEERPA